MSTSDQLGGYLLEEALAWLLRNSGYRLLVDHSQDPDELVSRGNGLCVKGRGAEHQVDVLGEFAFTPAFSLPIILSPGSGSTRSIESPALGLSSSNFSRTSLSTAWQATACRPSNSPTPLPAW